MKHGEHVKNPPGWAESGIEALRHCRCHTDKHTLHLKVLPIARSPRAPRPAGGADAHRWPGSVTRSSHALHTSGLPDEATPTMFQACCGGRGPASWRLCEAITTPLALSGRPQCLPGGPAAPLPPPACSPTTCTSHPASSPARNGDIEGCSLSPSSKKRTASPGTRKRLLAAAKVFSRVGLSCQDPERASKQSQGMRWSSWTWWTRCRSTTAARP